jgi:hypothetical protein
MAKLRKDPKKIRDQIIKRDYELLKAMNEGRQKIFYESRDAKKE